MIKRHIHNGWNEWKRYRWNGKTWSMEKIWNVWNILSVNKWLNSSVLFVCSLIRSHMTYFISTTTTTECIVYWIRWKIIIKMLTRICCLSTQTTFFLARSDICLMRNCSFRFNNKSNISLDLFGSFQFSKRVLVTFYCWLKMSYVMCATILTMIQLPWQQNVWLSLSFSRSCTVRVEFIRVWRHHFVYSQDWTTSTRLPFTW